jgi:hypothetical protein
MRACKHLYQPNRCPVVDCSHHDTRDLATQLFGPGGSNSELATRLYRTNKPDYDAAKQEAISRGWLPLEVVPVCLRDPE